MNKLKKLTIFLFSLVMLISPVFFTGCSIYDLFSYGGKENEQPINNNQGNNQNNNQGNQGSGQNNNNNQGNDKPVEINYDEMADYIKNYRVTYKPNNADKSQFDEEVIKQNVELSKQILNELFNEYGLAEQSKFSQSIENIMTDENNYLLFKTEQNQFVKTNYDVQKEISHSNAINKDSVDKFGNDISWLWNTKSSEIEATKENFVDGEFAVKFQIAELLILSGETINQDGSGSFYSKYATYFDDNNLQNNLKQGVVVDGKLNQNLFANELAKIEHLGFTETEQESLKNFVFNYVIGQNLMQLDNQRFVNCYFDGDDIKIVNDEKYNKFLTTEILATAIIEDDSFDYLNTSNQLYGLQYYIFEYLKQNSLNQSQTVFIKTSWIGEDLNSATEISNSADIASKVFEKIINYDNNFNANVWNFDEQGNVDSNNKTEFVKYVSNNQEYSLFSVRKPYFKNYFNTISFMFEDIFNSPASEETKQTWFNNHSFEYPYNSNYPTIPFSYFADYSYDEMELKDEFADNLSKSGNQAYQSFVVMPNKDFLFESAVIFFSAPQNHNTDLESMDIKIYARYFDAESSSFAKWDSNGVESEFYQVGSVNVVFGLEDDIEFAEVDLKDILTTAKINGQQKNDYILKEYNLTEKVDEKSLITKENFGYLYQTVSTPDGKSVVCYNGGNSSYIEFVFYSEVEDVFAFSFVPDMAYKLNNN